MNTAIKTEYLAKTLLLFVLLVGGKCPAVDTSIAPSAATSASPQAPPLVPVEVMHPREGWDVTDFAVYFRWKTQSDRKAGWHALKYQLQVADEPTFAKPHWDRIVEAPNDPSKPQYHYWKQMSWHPEERLPAGKWFWRVRVADQQGGPWSAPAVFQVNSDQTITAPRRELSAKQPLFVFNMYRMEEYKDFSWETYQGFIPADLQPFVAFLINRYAVGSPGYGAGYPDNDVDYTEIVRRATDAGAQVCIGTGGPDKPVSNYADLAEIEWLFQHCPKVVGAVIGETFWAYGEREKQETPYYQRLLQLCAKYGRYYIQGDGNWGRFNWDKLLAGAGRLDSSLLRSCAQSFVPCAKNNIRDSYFEAEGAVMGGWLAGLTGNHGRWCEAWYWSDVGFTDPFKPALNKGDMSKMPAIFWNQNFLTGVAAGASVLMFGGETSVTQHGVYDAANDRFTQHADVGPDYTAVWDGHGHKTPVLDRYVIPFLRAVVKQGLIPEKAEVLRETRLAVASAPPKSDRVRTKDYGLYAPLYCATYGLRDFRTLDPAINPPALALALNKQQGRFLRIQKAGKGGLELAEVHVMSGQHNVATSGTATQSSVYYGCDARRAIDGNTDGREESHSVAITKSEDQPWWELDLGAPREVESIEVFNRNERGNYAHLPNPHEWIVSLLDEQRRPVWSGSFPDAGAKRAVLGAEYEVLPNNGRYYFIPVLPDGAAVLPGVETVGLDKLASEQAVKARFDAVYPNRSTGNAWVCQAGDRVFVMNSHENTNETQDYGLAFDNGRFLRRISGVALPHWYLMGRWTNSGQAFWFQANANQKGPYTDGRQTRVVLECAEKPLVTVNPPKAMVAQTWNAQRGELTLAFSHDAGAVEVTLTPQ